MAVQSSLSFGLVSAMAETYNNGFGWPLEKGSTLIMLIQSQSPTLSPSPLADFQL